ncbi:MAG: hypothetical protein CMN32_13230 [Saprospirales bacterium]|jgi:hypothetical protein|nr:hypothetical protein [Saprospirales bacterium]
MKYLIFSLLVIIGACSQPADGEQQQTENGVSETPELICKEVRNADEHPDSPLSEVYVRMGDYQLKVADVTICMSMDKSEYASQNIPDTALSAVGGWWAGGGDYFFLIADGENYRIMYKAEDESMEAPADFETVMVLSKDGEIVAPQ